jgi:DNA polymerase elongation subunit (family B)
MAYRNVYYDGKQQAIHLWTWDENGKRIKIEASYEPYLYVESNNHQDAVSIFNTPLKKIKFKNQFERNKFVNETPIKRLFHNLSCEQDFLLSTFKDDVYKPDFGKNPLKIFYWDIETYSPGEFPNPENANDPINLITIYDTSSEKFYSWGLKPYTPTDPDVIYTHCKREIDIYEKMLNFWENDPPDIMTGWNTEGFDVPYLMNRIHKMMGEDEASRLSPVRSLYYRENVALNKFGKMINRWYIRGVSNIDYMEVYKTFSRGDSESYSLNYISEKELNEGKTDIGGTNLASLSETDWDTFVKYNIQDVRLLVKLENKLKYLKLVKNLSYKGFIPFEQSLGKVSMITGAVAHQASLQNYTIPTFKSDHTRDEYVGGYVHEPERGLNEAVLSYDANSLYPNTIISLNISPETKIGKVLSEENGEVNIRLATGKTINLTKDKFDKLVEKELLSISKYNILYTQKFKGVIPNLIDRLYNERVQTKDEIQKNKQALHKEKDPEKIKIYNDNIFNLDTQQNVLKLILNSIYGTFAQQYSPLFDIDHSASITLTGQTVVKQAADIVYEYAKNKGFNGKKSDIYKYSDTDSIYISIKPLLDFLKYKFLNEDKEISSDTKEVIYEIDEILNREIIDWAKKNLKSIDPRFVFKRETICDKALFLEKKRYILHVLDQEGYKPSKPFKYVGVEVARSSISKEVKNLIKNVIENIITTADKKKCKDIFEKTFEDFCKLDAEIIAKRVKISDLEKYESKIVDGKVAKGTPNHVKGAIYYNNLLKKYSIDNVYESIGSGMKVKTFYLTKNPFNYKSIAFIDKIPSQLQEFIKPDFQTMFEKNVVPPIESVYNCVGWQLPQIGQTMQTDLFDLFGFDD